MAGSNGAITIGQGGISGLADSNVYGISWVATADASAATFVDQTIGRDTIGGGFIASVSVKFGSPAPSGLTVTITDRLGISKVVSTFSASGTDALSPMVPFVGPLTVALSGNTTNSAVATVDIGVV